MKEDIKMNVKSNPSEMGRRRWRKQFGIRLACSLKPEGKKIVAKCVCEGELYKAEGKTHTEAMLNVTNLVNKKKLSLEK